jgi:transposase
MAKPLVSDELWAIIEPLIPKVERRYRFPGRKRIDDRRVLTGILYVLKTGIPWEYLPQEMGCGSGMTCWRRLQEWQRAGVWQRLHEVLLARLHAADQIDWSRAVIDSSHVRAVGGRADRSKPCRPPQKRLQAPYAHLRTGHSTRVVADSRQRKRHRATAAARRCDPSRARQAWTAAPPAAAATRRRRLPLAPPPPRVARPWHQRRDQPAETATRLRARHAPLGRRADDLLAAPAPPPARPLRTSRRHPRRPLTDRRLPDLLQAPPSRGVILLGVLSDKPLRLPLSVGPGGHRSKGSSQPQRLLRRVSVSRSSGRSDAREP